MRGAQPDQPLDLSLNVVRVQTEVLQPEMRVRIAGAERGEPTFSRTIGAKREWPGRVVEIASQAEFTPRVALTESEQANLVFGVKVALAPSGGALKAGLPADARFPSR